MRPMSTPTVAEQIAPVIERLAGKTDLPIRVKAWDNSEVGPPGAPAIVLNSRNVLRRLLWQPNELGLGRAYVAGELEFEGDIINIIVNSLSFLGNSEDGRSTSLSRAEWMKLVKTAMQLGAFGREPKPPAEEWRPASGKKHSRARDKQAISHHYDVGNEFYRLFLGPSLVYSCAYWTRPDDPAYTLEDAQRDKLDLICRKLQLKPGQRLLDIGCGWGSMVIHAAKFYGAKTVGVTISEEQAMLARQRAREEGLADLVEIRLQDYREVKDGPYDAISSIGMAEHVGGAKYAEYAQILFGLLKPGGRLLNHQIARSTTREQGSLFVRYYVFPDGDLQHLGSTVSSLENAGLEVRDVECLRENYSRTLRCWVDNLESNYKECESLTSPGRARIWRLYMNLSTALFDMKWVSVNQVLAVRPHANGRSDLPPIRNAWLLQSNIQ